jgi:hypothetical protein
MAILDILFEFPLLSMADSVDFLSVSPYHILRLSLQPITIFFAGCTAAS